MRNKSYNYIYESEFGVYIIRCDKEFSEFENVKIQKCIQLFENRDGIIDLKELIDLALYDFLHEEIHGYKIVISYTIMFVSNKNIKELEQ